MGDVSLCLSVSPSLLSRLCLSVLSLRLTNQHARNGQHHSEKDGLPSQDDIIPNIDVVLLATTAGIDLSVARRGHRQEIPFCASELLSVRE